MGSYLNEKGLKQKVLEKMKQFIIMLVNNYSNEKGEICFIALEYFYDGAHADIGLRIGLQEERLGFEEDNRDYDVREDGGNFSFYKPILIEDTVRLYFDSLAERLNNADKENNELFYIMIKEIASNLSEELKKIDWPNFAFVSSDFLVLGPYEYD